MDVFEAIRTTRAMRRLDPERPVSDADLLTIIEAATKGPSGGNSQPARWLVARDADVRRRLGEIYSECWKPVRERYAKAAVDDPGTGRVLRSADHLGDHMGDAPAIVIPCAPPGSDASIFGCVQNLFLAARALGLGTTLTTVHRLKEDEVKEVLGVPESTQTYALIPVGYPLGSWGEAQRRPVRDVVYWDRWKTPPPG
jgi:nitroreductase